MRPSKSDLPAKLNGAYCNQPSTLQLNFTATMRMRVFGSSSSGSCGQSTLPLKTASNVCVSEIHERVWVVDYPLDSV